MLLPRREKDPESGEAEEDPRDELVTKLFRIPSVQGKCLILKELETSRSRIYFRSVNDKRLLAALPPSILSAGSPFPISSRPFNRQ